MNNSKNIVTQLVKLIAAFMVSWMLVLLVFTAASPNEEVPDKYNLLTVILGFVLAFAVTIITDFNKISRLKNQIKKTSADIDSVNETANALIDKAERVADKYRADETGVYKDFALARKNEKKIRSSKDFKAVMEAYPELQANVHTQKLLNQIETAENAKLNARLNYTSAVAAYNTKIHSFPVVMLRKICKWDDIEVNLSDSKEDLVSDEELGI